MVRAIEFLTGEQGLVGWPYGTAPNDVAPCWHERTCMTIVMHGGLLRCMHTKKEISIWGPLLGSFQHVSPRVRLQGVCLFGGLVGYIYSCGSLNGSLNNNSTSRYLGQDPLPSWWRKLPLPVLTKVTAWEPRCHWSTCMHAASGYAYAHIKLQFEGTRQLEHEPISNLPLFVNIEPRHLVQISQPWKTYKGYESLSKSTDGVCKFLCAIFVYPFNNRNVLSIHASSLVTGLESTVTVTGSGSLFFRYYI